MPDTVSSAVQAIEAEIVVQQSRRDLILRHLQQPAMVPGTRVYAAHANRAETLRYEILGLQRALAVVKHREALLDPTESAVAMTAAAAHRAGLL